jgi:hypothetical protein
MGCFLNCFMVNREMMPHRLLRRLHSKQTDSVNSGIGQDILPFRAVKSRLRELKAG